jgi:hypothetical protein
MPKYDSIKNIPADVFFEIKKTNNLQLLKPKPREKDLDKVFEIIDDDFFTRSKNAEAKRYLELFSTINYLNFKIATLKTTLHSYYYNETNLEMRQGLADALKEGYNIDLDLKVPFGQEVLRILNVEIGAIKNDLVEAQTEFDNLIKKSQSQSSFDYFKSIVDLSTALPNNSLINDRMTLLIYVELCNKAKEISDKHENEKILSKMRK